MKKSFLLSLLVLFCLMLAPAADVAAQQVQKVFNYQAYLSDAQNRPYNGNVSVLFEIWDAEFGGNVVWTEPQQSVTAIDGYINAYLGRVSPMNLKFNRQYWLQVTVNGNRFDRTIFTSSPYALYAIDADTALHAFMADAVVLKGVKQDMLDDGIQALPWGPAGGDLQGTYPNPRLRPNSIVENILPGTITFDKLHPDARVPHGKAGGDLTDEYPNPSIAANAVTEVKIRDGAITSRKIANGTIRVEDLNPTEFLYWDKDYRDDLTIYTEFDGDVEGTWNTIKIKEAVITEYELAPTGVNFGFYGDDVTKMIPYFLVDEDGRLNFADEYPLFVTPNELESTTVVAGAYGDATNIPSFIVDEDGRLTYAEEFPLVVGPDELLPTGVIAGDYGDMGDNCTPGTVPYFSVDEDGRITAAGEMQITSNFIVPGAVDNFLVTSMMPGCSTEVATWKPIAFDPEYFSGSIFSGNGLQLAPNAVKATNIDGRGVQQGWVLMADGANNVNWVKYALTLPYEGVNTSDVTGFKVRSLDNPNTNANNVIPSIAGITEDDFGHGGMFTNLNINSQVAALKAVSESNNALGTAFEAISDPPVRGYVAKIWDDNHRNNANGRALLLQSNSAANFPYQSVLNGDPTDLDEATLVVRNTNANASKIAIKTYGDIVANSMVYATQLAAGEAIYVGSGNNIVTITPPANVGDPLAFDNSVSIDGDLDVTGVITGHIVSPWGTFTNATVTNDLFVGNQIYGDLTGDVTGNLTGNVTGNVTGNLTGNVTGNVTGNLTGNVTGDVTGNLTGNVTGNVTGGWVNVQGAHLTLGNATQFIANTGLTQGPGAAGNFLVSRGANLSPEWTSTISGPLNVTTINATTGNITNLNTTTANFTNVVVNNDMEVLNEFYAERALAGELFVGGDAFIGGILFGDVTGNLTGNVTGNVTGNLTGNVTGNLTGNVLGNVTGNLTGNVTAGNISINGTTNTITGVTNISATTFTGGSFIGDGSQLTGVLHSVPSFDALTASTLGNPNALLVAGSLAPTGTGIVTANDIVNGTIINADINANAGIEYSKLSVPDGAIGYAKLNIANGDIPYAKLTVADGDIPYAKLTVADGAISGAKLTDGTVTSAKILDGTIVNADISATAAIDYSKLNVPDGAIGYAKLNIANGDIPYAKLTVADAEIPWAKINAPSVLTTTTAFGGNVSGAYDAIAINAGVIDNTHVSATAAIAGTKISPNFGSQFISTAGGLTTGIATLNAAAGVFTNDGSVPAVSINGTSGTTALDVTGNVVVAGKAYSTGTLAGDLATTLTTKGYVDALVGGSIPNIAGEPPIEIVVVGGITTIGIADNGITSNKIADGTIVNADISATAAIDYSKLNVPDGAIGYAKLNIADGDIPYAKLTVADGTISGAKLTDGTVTSAKILDGTIVNADISATAAIDYSKVNVPDGAIGYAKLNVADGDIPYAKLSVADAQIPWAKVNAPSVLTTTTNFTGDVTGTFDATVVNHSLQKSYEDGKDVLLAGGNHIEISGTGDAFENALNIYLDNVQTIGDPNIGKATIASGLYSNTVITENHAYVFGDLSSVRPVPNMAGWTQVAGAAGDLGGAVYGALGWQLNNAGNAAHTAGVYGFVDPAINAVNYYAGYFDGKVHITGKATSGATVAGDAATTLVTKGYMENYVNNNVPSIQAGQGIAVNVAGTTTTISVPNGGITDAMIDPAGRVIFKTADNKYPAMDGSLITNINAGSLSFPIDRTVDVADPNAALKLTNTGTGSVFSAVVNNNTGKALTISVPGAGHNENAVSIDYNGIGNAMLITSGNAGNSGYGLAVDYAGSGNGIASYANGGGSAIYGEVAGGGTGLNVNVTSTNGRGIFVNVQNTNHDESAVNIDYQGKGTALNVLIGDNLANTGMGAIIDDYRAAGTGLAVLKNGALEPTLNTALFTSNGLTSSQSIGLQVGKGKTILAYAEYANNDGNLSGLGYASVIHYTGTGNVTLPTNGNNGQVLVISVTNNVTIAGVNVLPGNSIMLVYSGNAWRPVR